MIFKLATQPNVFVNCFIPQFSLPEQRFQRSYLSYHGVGVGLVSPGQIELIANRRLAIHAQPDVREALEANTYPPPTLMLVKPEQPREKH